MILLPNRRQRLVSCALAAFAATMLALPSGCGEKKPKPKPVSQTPVAPPRPPAPEKIDVAALLQAMGSDARVQFPDSAAPTNEGLARAAITVANALARGDSDTLAPMLGPLSASVLDNLTASGDWDVGTGKIEAVRIVRAIDAGEGKGVFVTAIQDNTGAYVLRWVAAPMGGSYMIEATMAPSEVKRRASDWDTISGDEVALAVPGAVEAPASDDDAGDDAQAQSPDEAEGRDPNTVRTPAGPITIPGG